MTWTIERYPTAIQSNDRIAALNESKSNLPVDAGARFFNRVAEWQFLWDFLQTKLSHENAKRQVLWAQMAFYLTVTAAACPVSVWAVGQFSDWNSRCGSVIATVQAALSAIAMTVIAWRSFVATQPKDNVALYRPGELARLLHDADKVGGDEQTAERDCRQHLMHNLGEAANFLHDENTARAKEIAVLRRWLAFLLAVQGVSLFIIGGHAIWKERCNVTVWSASQSSHSQAGPPAEAAGQCPAAPHAN